MAASPSDADATFHAGKLLAARWFFDHERHIGDHAARVLKAMDPIPARVAGLAASRRPRNLS